MASTSQGHPVRNPQDLHTKVEVQLDQAAEEVARRLAGKTSYETVRIAVSDAYQRLSAVARIHNYLPILAARSAQARLEATFQNSAPV
jgi:hypothetical protein